jgi:uncharacterized membrane protein
MPKKRVKSKARKASKKHHKKSSKKKETSKLSPEGIPQITIKDTLNHRGLVDEEKKVEHAVELVGKKESQIAKDEKNIIKETKKIENMERRIEKEVKTRPLSGFTLKDLNKGIVGAFIGVVAHFGFVYGKAIAGDITILRASLILVFSYLLIVLLMYETGYREIKEKRLLGLLPKRATYVYITSILVVFAIFYIFNMVDLSDYIGLYKQIAVTSVLASLGAGTADLLGKH